MKINRVVYHVILFLQRLMILMFSNTVYLQNVNIIYKKVVTSSIYKNFVRLKYILPRDEDLKWYNGKNFCMQFASRLWKIFLANLFYDQCIKQVFKLNQQLFRFRIQKNLFNTENLRNSRGIWRSPNKLHWLCNLQKVLMCWEAVLLPQQKSVILGWSERER